MNQETFRNTIFVLKDEMFRFARRFLTSAEESEDVVQDLMMKFWQRKEELTGINIKSYAMRCVKNECLNRLKHETVKYNFAQMAIHREQKYMPEVNNLKDKIVEYINQLPEKQKLVIHLKDVEGYETAEICEALEMDANAVRVNLQRARQKIREQISALLVFENRTL